jgi:hypothetical protein
MTLGMSTAIDPRLSAAFSDIERYRCAMAQLTTLLETYVVAGGGADLKDTYAVSLKYGPPARTDHAWPLARTMARTRRGQARFRRVIF